MLDEMLVLRTAAASAVTAAVVLLVVGWPWRAPRPVRSSVGCILGAGIGFFVGCWLLGWRAQWSLAEDKDRMMLLVVPAVILVELCAAFLGPARWPAWLLRLGVAAGAARVLLHDTGFLVDKGLPDTPEWTPTQARLILAGLAAALAIVWAALMVLTTRTARSGSGGATGGLSVPLVVALTCGGAGLTVAYSGYATGGLLGVPLAAALTGAMVASLAFSTRPDLTGVIGLGVVGLFAVLVVGRFFGSVTTTNAALLFFAPLLCWLPELPPRFRGVVRVAVAATPVAIALTLAQAKFVADSARPTPRKTEPAPPPGVPEITPDDYRDFRP
jgi:hypothetical protein